VNSLACQSFHLSQASDLAVVLPIIARKSRS
jgi:hypothetical protein